ncbi:3-oxoacyl-[acyl-carrier-protein] synthase 3 [Sphaerisporangium krabiense]|uniref:Beta-ketoacyl-[acyl-carrier-protein] synthase III n=1 Tax=Sphaerisporangium krabiense TaxID=763782 RepID=A0A7W8Z219_9ACTN|nr:beta-ketoacyl-ACP synthase III [Sphaerisporangium krabiense]MBB5626028.1 3-oxoacyl-[acyl-carrier-protein] synthase-3 [Sphaerisporangium krabiense]GII64833.1 3-oxoacyl-[acyl-carrier-protein] synthase 3 [Sphaerisporangium krabiense]
MTGDGTPPADRAAAVICGIGHWLPPRVVTNADLCARLDTTEEWILSRTGIAARRVAGEDLTTADLAAEAGARALKSAGGHDVQALMLATTTPDRACPATAPEVASRLGLTGVAAFDVSAVCSGFLYALAAATGFIAAGHADRVLLVAAERFTSLLDPLDRTTVPIFGDGAGAVVLRRGAAAERGAVGRVFLGSDGENRDLIRVEDGYFRMEGRAVFRQAVERMAEAARAAAGAAGWSMDDVDRMVAHQANARVSAAVAAELGIPADRQAQNIRDVGNTAAASIPILLGQATADGVLAPGHRVLVTAFGGGLTWGATTVVWPDLETAP